MNPTHNLPISSFTFYSGIVQNPEVKNPLEKHGCRWENIKIYLREQHWKVRIGVIMIRAGVRAVLIKR
jgi:hypothetical protein